MTTDAGIADTELVAVCSSIVDACAVLEQDRGASAVLRAVVDEFMRKACKTRDLADSSGRRDAVIELEQAADSAKAAAEADVGAAEAGVEAIRQAHLEICVLKSQLLSQ